MEKELLTVTVQTRTDVCGLPSGESYCLSVWRQRLTVGACPLQWWRQGRPDFPRGTEACRNYTTNEVANLSRWVGFAVALHARPVRQPGLRWLMSSQSYAARTYTSQAWAGRRSPMIIRSLQSIAAASSTAMLASSRREYIASPVLVVRRGDEAGGYVCIKQSLRSEQASLQDLRYHG